MEDPRSASIEMVIKAVYAEDETDKLLFMEELNDGSFLWPD